MTVLQGDTVCVECMLNMFCISVVTKQHTTHMQHTFNTRYNKVTTYIPHGYKTKTVLDVCQMCVLYGHHPIPDQCRFNPMSIYISNCSIKLFIVSWTTNNVHQIQSLILICGISHPHLDHPTWNEIQWHDSLFVQPLNTHLKKIFAEYSISFSILRVQGQTLHMNKTSNHFLVKFCLSWCSVVSVQHRCIQDCDMYHICVACVLCVCYICITCVLHMCHICVLSVLHLGVTCVLYLCYICVTVFFFDFSQTENCIHQKSFKFFFFLFFLFVC